jgi:hypothetical protein
MKQQVKEFMYAIGLKPLSFDEANKGNLKQRLLDRIQWHQEELNELKDALEENDWTAALDAIVDIRYFALQDEIELEEAGFDVAKAKELVCENNSLKYTISFELANRWARELNTTYIYVDVNQGEDGLNHYCIKDLQTDKVKKYYDFPKVDLSSCVPDKFKSE